LESQHNLHGVPTTGEGSEFVNASDSPVPAPRRITARNRWPDGYFQVLKSRPRFNGYREGERDRNDLRDEEAESKGAYIQLEITGGGEIYFPSISRLEIPSSFVGGIRADPNSQRYRE